MRISDAINGYLIFKSQTAAPSTLKTDRVHLDQFAAWLGRDEEAHTLTTERITEYLLYQRNRGLSPFTIRRHRAVLSHMFSWLSAPHNGIVAENIVKHTTPPKLPRRKVQVLTEDEVGQLIDSAHETQTPKRDEAIVRFMIDSCCRATEVCTVSRSDLDLKTGRAFVTGKGSKERFVWIGNRALHSAWLYLNTERPQHQQRDADMLFLTHDGCPMNRNTLRLLYNRLGRKAGVPRVHPHLMRHTGALWRLLAGMNLEMLRQFLGHESIKTTQVYLSGLSDKDMAQASARTSPGDNLRL